MCVFVWLNVLLLLACLFTIGHIQVSIWTVWVCAGVSDLGLVTIVMTEWTVVKVDK